MSAPCSLCVMPDDQPATHESDDGRTPFQRFEDFARKIIAVPKREIDELEKQGDDEPH